MHAAGPLDEVQISRGGEVKWRAEREVEEEFETCPHDGWIHSLSAKVAKCGCFRN